MRLSSNKKF